jgi:acetyl/propionyl-CoA carboxylase alpha subunit
MQRALNELKVQGLKTTIPFHSWAMANEAFRSGDLHTGFIEEHWTGHRVSTDTAEIAAIGAAILEFRKKHRSAITVSESDGPTSHWKLAGRRSMVRGLG